MTFPAQVNSDLLYRSPDGREGFVIFDRSNGLVHFGQDITAPDTHRSVGFTSEALRKIADMLDHPDPQRARFVCPACGGASSHPKDLAEGYCGRCHAFTGEPQR